MTPRAALRACTPRRLAAAVAAAVVALFVLGLLPVETVRVSSDSMSPTLSDGDRVLLVHGGGHPRGEIVALADPGGSGLLVKRIVAVGGDRFAIEDGLVVVNGVRAVEPWSDQSRIDGVYVGPLRVPDGHVYVLGDNRGDSVDSRDFGPVPDDTLEGRLAFRLWPAPGDPT